LFFDESKAWDIPREDGMTFEKHSSDSGNPESLFSRVRYIVSPSLAEQKRAFELFVGIKDEFDSGAKYHELPVKAKMLELLTLYLRAAERGGESGKKAWSREWKNLERAIQFIHKNYRRQISVAELSAAAGLSRSYFCRLFKSYTGVSAHQYINTVRVKEAAKLLAEGKLNISQTAEQSGFSSVYLFSRIFKKIEGSAPSKFTQERH
jgi:AraC-like DNA-binding protein